MGAKNKEHGDRGAEKERMVCSCRTAFDKMSVVSNPFAFLSSSTPYLLFVPTQCPLLMHLSHF